MAQPTQLNTQNTYVHTNTGGGGLERRRRESISSCGLGKGGWWGFSSPERDGQTGFHTPLVGRNEPLVNCAVTE